MAQNSLFKMSNVAVQYKIGENKRIQALDGVNLEKPSSG